MKETKKIATNNYKEEDGKYYRQYFSVEQGVRDHYLKFYWIEINVDDYNNRAK